MKHLQSDIMAIHNAITRIDPESGVLFDKLIVNFQTLLDKKNAEIKLLKEDIEYLRSEEAEMDL